MVVGDYNEHPDGSSSSAEAVVEITVGVLALQGAFVEHIRLLELAAEDLVRVRLDSRLDRARSDDHDGQRTAVKRHADVATDTTETGHGASSHVAGTVSMQDVHAHILAHPQTVESEDQKPQSGLSSTTGLVSGDQNGVNRTKASVGGDPTGSHSAGSEARPSTRLSPSYGQEVMQDLDAAVNHIGASRNEPRLSFAFRQVRTPSNLAACDALILPGGESTAISLIAERTGLLEPLREFVKVSRRPVWGTCAGLILLAESANKSKSTGQELIGGLDVRVQRNYFGRQVESFEADLELPFLREDSRPFHSVFIRAPVVEKVLTGQSTNDATTQVETVLAPARKATKAPVEILSRLPGRARAIRDQTTTAEDLGEEGDIVAVRQGNVFGTAFHPELTGDPRIHVWWLQEVVNAVMTEKESGTG